MKKLGGGAVKPGNSQTVGFDILRVGNVLTFQHVRPSTGKSPGEDFSENKAGKGEKGHGMREIP